MHRKLPLQPVDPVRKVSEGPGSQMPAPPVLTCKRRYLKCKKKKNEGDQAAPQRRAPGYKTGMPVLPSRTLRIPFLNASRLVLTYRIKRRGTFVLPVQLPMKKFKTPTEKILCCHRGERRSFPPSTRSPSENRGGGAAREMPTPPPRSGTRSPAHTSRCVSPESRCPAHLARSRRAPAPPGAGRSEGRTGVGCRRRRRAGRRSCGGSAAACPPSRAAKGRAPRSARGAGARRSAPRGSRRGAAAEAGRGAAAGRERRGGRRRPAPARGLRAAPRAPAPPRSRPMSWCQSRRLASISPSHRARDAKGEGGAAASR